MRKWVALIGLGYWGKNILRSFHELGVLHTACDSDISTIQQWKIQLPDVHYTISYDEVLHDATGGTKPSSDRAFSQLGASQNGYMIYCSDCTVNSVPCSASGSGAIAKRLNGAWRCD